MFKPSIGAIPLAEGLAWNPSPQWRWEEKKDGIWHELGIGSSIITGELMGDGDFFAFDIPIFNGQDIRQKPLIERLPILDSFKLKRPPSGTGGEFLCGILANGGEGVVIKNLEAPYGYDWGKCKRVETFDCVITEKHDSKHSVRLSLSGEDCGWCPAIGKFNALHAGDIVEVSAFCRNASGKFREPRIVRIRRDKMLH